MHVIFVYVLIGLVYKIESLTFCDDQKCVCLNKNEGLKISCSSHSTVLAANYTLSDNVTTLDLSRNNLTRIQRPLVSDTLIELLLNSNQIEEIANDTLRLPSLKILDLSHNNLKFIHKDTFSQINNLECLNLTNNKFNAFGNINFYYLKKLQEIVFDDNNIGPSLENHSLFEGGLQLTKEIQSISLRNVNLTANNKHVFLDAREHLKKLILSHNNMTDFIDLPDKLVYLDLSSNPIKRIPRDVFIFTTDLSVLKLNNILIEEVQGFAFFYLCSLHHLELEKNRNLKQFSPLAWGRVIVKDQIDLFVNNLTLRGSNLTSLDVKMAGIFKKIKRVDLRDNPWICDCRIAWLQEIEIPEELMDFRCSSPSNLFNRRIHEVNSTEFICEEEKISEESNPIITIAIYCILLTFAVLMMYFFIFSAKPFLYRQLPLEFPRTP
ncbi:tsukushi-like [Epargyreus clarus]|uniref:tsukushi-like n=1 Tax=Epargyreus clarus TaxID=520877 RepID=UPI003C2D4CA4